MCVCACVCVCVCSFSSFSASYVRVDVAGGSGGSAVETEKREHNTIYCLPHLHPCTLSRVYVRNIQIEFRLCPRYIPIRVLCSLHGIWAGIFVFLYIFFFFFFDTCESRTIINRIRFWNSTLFKPPRNNQFSLWNKKLIYVLVIL